MGWHLATAQQSPAGSPVLCTPAQVAQGWLRTQPDSGPSQLLAFMVPDKAQSQFSTLGEREEARIHLSPASHSQREGPQELTKVFIYFKYLGGWEFPRKSWFHKRPKPQGQERCCGLNCIPLNSYVGSPNPQCVGVWRWASKALANPQSPLFDWIPVTSTLEPFKYVPFQDRSTTILK